MSGPGEGVLAAAFSHIVFKRLSAVEADAGRSNQHEFNASSGLRAAFGRDQPQRLTTDFIWMPDDGAYVRERGVLTWYDARARHPTRSEYRLYYRDNDVTRRAGPGDLLLIARRRDGTVLLLMAPGAGEALARISWLFGIDCEPGASFAALAISPEVRRDLARGILGDVSTARDEWSEDRPFSTGMGDRSVRAQAGQSQRMISVVTDTDGDWSDLAISLPDNAPQGLGGEVMGQTIEGLLKRDDAWNKN